MDQSGRAQDGRVTALPTLPGLTSLPVLDHLHLVARLPRVEVVADLARA